MNKTSNNNQIAIDVPTNLVYNKDMTNNNTTKKDIANTIAMDSGITQIQAAQLVQQTLDAIANALRDGGRIELRDFGVFECKTRKARIGRNPKTGASVSIPEKVVVGFKAGKKMEETIQKSPIGA
jgi:nucleoid DNA-binding protein|tara:strand:+ start:280 stop:654 length:375 start_codon:yes stop_codon:yes gene_type:complete